MTFIGHLAIGFVGWSLLLIVTAASFRPGEGNDAWPPRCLCLLTVAVLLILYGCGAPSEWKWKTTAPSAPSATAAQNQPIEKDSL